MIYLYSILYTEAKILKARDDHFKRLKLDVKLAKPYRPHRCAIEKNARLENIQYFSSQHI